MCPTAGHISCSYLYIFLLTRGHIPCSYSYFLLPTGCHIPAPTHISCCQPGVTFLPLLIFLVVNRVSHSCPYSYFLLPTGCHIPAPTHISCCQQGVTFLPLLIFLVVNRVSHSCPYSYFLLPTGCHIPAPTHISCCQQGVTFPAVHALLGRWSPPLERSKMASFTFSGKQLFLGYVLINGRLGALAHFSFSLFFLFYHTVFLFLTFLKSKIWVKHYKNCFLLFLRIDIQS